MKILLLKDVYHLGHAGDVKKVADGYGRNYLLPQGYAVLATAGALKQADVIREKAAVVRKQLNNEMSAVSERINNTWITFASKAGETGKLYGSITSQMVAEKIGAQLAPVGTVWAKIRAEHPDIDLFWKDGEHAGMYGDLIIAGILCRMVTGREMTPVDYARDFAQDIMIDFHKPQVLEDVAGILTEPDPDIVRVICDYVNSIEILRAKPSD